MFDWAGVEYAAAEIHFRGVMRGVNADPATQPVSRLARISQDFRRASIRTGGAQPHPNPVGGRSIMLVVHFQAALQTLPNLNRIRLVVAQLAILEVSDFADLVGVAVADVGPVSQPVYDLDHAVVTAKAFFEDGGRSLLDHLQDVPLEKGREFVG